MYSEIKQRPLAALLIHFFTLLSFVGMPDSVQSAVFKILAIFRPILRLSVLVSTLLLLSLQTALSPATRDWHMQHVHAPMANVKATVCLM